MKRLFPVFLAVIGCGVSTCLAGGETLDLTAFRHKVLMMVVGNVDGTLADFPLLVRIDESHVRGWAGNASPDGSDIRFADEHGTLLAHEIDTWTTDESGAASGIVWVKVPELKTGTILQMCWGADPATLPAVDSTDVWTEYLGVWHFGESAGAIKDSTANHLDLLLNGTMSAAEESCIGGATFAGPNTAFVSLQSLVAGSSTNHGSQCTFSGFFKHAGSDERYYPALFMTKNAYDEKNGGICAGFYHYDKMYFTGGSDAVADQRVSVPAVNANWLAFAAAIDGQNGKLYNRGEFVGNIPLASAVTDANAPIVLGYDKGDNPGSSFYDEFRIRKTTSSPAWIKAEYDAFADADFLYCGDFAQYEPDVFRYRAKVTFRGDAQESLTNFPALVRIGRATIPGFAMSQLGVAADSAFRFQRLCFTDQSGAVLPYDVDQWDESEDGELLVWVKIPVLRPRTSVTVRWGLRKPVAFDPRTMPPSTDVWTEYLGVWHFGEASGQIKDSTANHLDLKLTSGTMSAAEESCIGGATLAGPSTAFTSLQSLVAGSTTNHGSQCTFSGFFKQLGGENGFYPVLFMTKNSYDETNGGICAGFYKLAAMYFTGGSDAVANQRVTVPAVNENWLAFAAAIDGQSGMLYNLGKGICDIPLASAVTDANAPMTIGYLTSNPYSSLYDEFRIRKVTSSPTWIKAEYETARDPSFASYGAAREKGGLAIILK